MENYLTPLCLKVKKLCPKHKLKDELYRPKLVGGQVLGPATEHEKTAFVTIYCLSDQSEYHANNNDAESMGECLNLINQIEQVLYPEIKKKYNLGVQSKVSFNKDWQVVLL